MSGPPPPPFVRRRERVCIIFGLVCVAALLVLALYTAANPCRTVYEVGLAGRGAVVSSSCGAEVTERPVYVPKGEGLTV